MVWCGTGELSDLERLRFVIFILALMNHKVLNQGLGVKFFIILPCFCIKTKQKLAKGKNRKNELLSRLCQ